MSNNKNKSIKLQDFIQNNRDNEYKHMIGKFNNLYEDQNFYFAYDENNDIRLKLKNSELKLAFQGGKEQIFYSRAYKLKNKDKKDFNHLVQNYFENLAFSLKSKEDIENLFILNNLDKSKKLDLIFSLYSNIDFVNNDPEKIIKAFAVLRDFENKIIEEKIGKKIYNLKSKGKANKKINQLNDFSATTKLVSNFFYELNYTKGIIFDGYKIKKVNNKTNELKDYSIKELDKIMNVLFAELEKTLSFRLDVFAKKLNLSKDNVDLQQYLYHNDFKLFILQSYQMQKFSEKLMYLDDPEAPKNNLYYYEMQDSFVKKVLPKAHDFDMLKKSKDGNGFILRLTSSSDVNNSILEKNLYSLVIDSNNFKSIDGFDKQYSIKRERFKYQPVFKLNKLTGGILHNAYIYSGKEKLLLDEVSLSGVYFEFSNKVKNMPDNVKDKIIESVLSYLSTNLYFVEESYVNKMHDFLEDMAPHIREVLLNEKFNTQNKQKSTLRKAKI